MNVTNFSVEQRKKLKAILKEVRTVRTLGGGQTGNSPSGWYVYYYPTTQVPKFIELRLRDPHNNVILRRIQVFP